MTFIFIRCNVTDMHVLLYRRTFPSPHFQQNNARPHVPEATMNMTILSCYIDHRDLTHLDHYAWIIAKFTSFSKDSQMALHNARKRQKIDHLAKPSKRVQHRGGGPTYYYYYRYYHSCYSILVCSCLLFLFQKTCTYTNVFSFFCQSVFKVLLFSFWLLQRSYHLS